MQKYFYLGSGAKFKESVKTFFFNDNIYIKEVS